MLVHKYKIEVGLTANELRRLTVESEKSEMTMAAWIIKKLMAPFDIVIETKTPEEFVLENQINKPAPANKDIKENQQKSLDPSPDPWKLPPLRDNFTTFVAKQEPRRPGANDGPRGITAILDVVRKIAKARSDIVARHGDKSGMYRNSLSAWFRENNMDNWTVTDRKILTGFAKEFDTFSRWAMALSDEDVSQDVSAWTVRRLWESRHQLQLPETRKKIDKRDIAAKLAAQGIGPIFREGKIEMAQIVYETPIRTSKIIVEDINVPDSVYQKFTEVDLKLLSPDEARVLRRFTDRLLRNTANVTTALPQATIASVITKIKVPNEKGNDPPTARKLLNLGVISGASGAYSLRPEFVSRFPEVERWVKQSANAMA